MNRFDGSIEDNVKYSCKTNDAYYDEERFWRSVELANSRAVIESHDEREKFIVGENGENLSGGQVRCVASSCVLTRGSVKEFQLLGQSESNQKF